MASSRVPEREVREQPRRVATANLDLCVHKHSLLVIIGRTAHLRQTGHISREIERGIRSWDVDLKSCNLNLHLQEFLSHHIASFKGVGQKCLRHSNRVLDTQVLISPAQEQVYSEVLDLLSRQSAHKLLILAGQSLEESGDLLFHRGLFSPHHLKKILTEQFIDQEISASSSKLSLTLSCPNVDQWRKTLLENQPVQGAFTLHINPPEVLPVMEALGEFTSLIKGTLSPPSLFDLLPPPTTVGFLKLSRPCCYVFPAGHGDCAFFAVNGFTVLVDGGSDSEACFWKLVRHLDRVDAVLLTHIGTENLPGVNAFLERKVAELELSSGIKDDSSKRLISPELGVVFFNAPNRLQLEEHNCADTVLKSSHQAALTLQLLNKLDIKPQPLFRPQGVPIEPITLFQKMGVGQLDVYILNPGKNSHEFHTFMQNWPDAMASVSKSQTLPLTALTSVSVLLVWHPACPQEKVVRVLFPGVTPQAKLIQGLEKLKGLAFLQRPTVTVESLGEDRRKKRTDSVDSGWSQGQETPPQHGRDWAVKDEVKDVLMREKGKILNGVNKRDTEKNRNRETSAKQKALSEKNTSKKGGKKEGKMGNKEENCAVKNSQQKNDVLPPKAKNENKTKPIKEMKRDSKTTVKKTRKALGKEANNGKRVHAKNGMTNNSSTKTAELEILEKDKQRQNQQPEIGYKEKPCSSKISSPEDMTADFLQEETTAQFETADKGIQETSEFGNEKSASGKQTSSKAADRQEEAACSAVIMREESTDNEGKDKGQIGEKTDRDLKKGLEDKPENTNESVKMAGFPSPLNTAARNEHSVQLDLTPTEFTLLDGALRYSPSSRPSSENQAVGSPDEETVEPDSSNSRPNSAGHTPYCLSPDDVWCNRATLNRLQAQMSNLESDVNQSNISLTQSESQLCHPKSTQESHTNPREKHLSFLSLGTCKEGSDPSPSVATTTTTTHSMPAEVSSPQSTEVDESLSMSLEQGPTTTSQREGDDSVHHSNSNGSHFVGMSLPMRKPPRALGQGSEMGRPPAPNALHCEASAHEVDLCLVSPCEFKHFKPTDSCPDMNDCSRGAFPSHHHGNNNNHPKDTSSSDPNVPVCIEDCPSTTADGALDSDENESCSEPSHSPCDLRASQTLPQDPLPAPLRDSPPLPPHPDTSMPVPQSDSDDNRKRTKATGKGKKTPMATQIPDAVKSRPGIQSGAVKGNVSSTRAPSSSTRTAPAKASLNPGSKSTSAGEVAVYVDLAYIPSGVSSSTVNLDFFRCVRSSCYIVSGDSPERGELLSHTLNALLDSKMSWPDNTQVTVIPTFESVQMQEWYQQTLERQQKLGITVLGSNSTVAMQDETFPACKIEF